MSLLLDALRRAAASKQGPEADQYVAPQRDDAVLEPDAEPDAEPVDAATAAGADAETDAAGSAGEQPGESADEELSLEPETDDAGPAAGEPRPTRGEEVARSAPAPGAVDTRPVASAAARTLLNARRGGRRRGRGILVALLAVIATAVLLAAGGWWYYQYSQQAAEQGLAAYEPTAEPLVDLPAEGGGDSGANMSSDDLEGGPDSGAAMDEPAAPVAQEPEVTMDAESGSAVAEEAPPAEDGGETEASAPVEAEPDPPAAEADHGTAAAEATEPADGGDSAGSNEDAGSAPASAPGEEPAKRQAQPLVTTSGTSVLSTALNAGYDALRAGDLASADREYSRALARDPDNRDALLGLASVAQRRGEPERAARYYQRILEDAPRDPHARAGLASLVGRIEPRRSEAVFKRLLQDQPESPPLHFSLGNVYAGESRWSEAQQAYFKAYSAEPDNAEYAYNLAVALDHLQQRDAALEHYRAALEVLGGESIAAFSAEAVRRRIEQLE